MFDRRPMLALLLTLAGCTRAPPSVARVATPVPCTQDAPVDVSHHDAALHHVHARRAGAARAAWRTGVLVGVERYLRAQAGRGARSEDLERALEASSGRDLGPFFATNIHAPTPPL